MEFENLEKTLLSISDKKQSPNDKYQYKVKLEENKQDILSELQGKSPDYIIIEGDKQLNEYYLNPGIYNYHLIKINKILKLF